MTAEQRTGQWIVLGIIAVLLVTSASIITLNVIALGPSRLPAQVVRFVLTVALLIWLYHGSPAAKWIMVVLLVLGSIVALLPGLIDGDRVVLYLGSGLAFLYNSFALALGVSSKVNAFLEYQQTHSARHFDAVRRVNAASDRDTVRFTCVYCYRDVELPRSAAGGTAPCPGCRLMTPVPDAARADSRSDQAP